MQRREILKIYENDVDKRYRKIRTKDIRKKNKKYQKVKSKSYTKKMKLVLEGNESIDEI